MEIDQNTGDPALSIYGWPLDRRRAFFDDAVKSSVTTFPVVFMGAKHDMKILTVPIDLPKYRLLNGRTASSQQEYLAKNSNVPKDFFEKDTERLDVQEVQHQLLSDVIKSGGLKQKFEDPSNKQIEPLILDEYGYVINGNRRLCAWRNLYHDASKKWEHFSHINVVVLPHSDDRAIDQLEASLQIEKDIRADYTWDSTANMMKKRQVLHKLSEDELARLYGVKPSEIKSQFEMLRYAEEYLKSRGKEHLWSLVSGDEEAFRKIVEKRQNLSSVGEKELFKEAAFVLIDNPDEVGGRLYDAIPNVQKYMEPIKVELHKNFSTETLGADSDDIFGGPVTSGSDIALSAVISKKENGKKAREIIREVIEDQKSLIKDAESAAYLLKLLCKANGAFETALATALRPESSKEGVADQLTSIEAKIKRIREWLNA